MNTQIHAESTPRDAGSGLMIIENDKIAGVPVFCTNYINNDGGIHVGLGVWSYQALGQFGEQRFYCGSLHQGFKGYNGIDP